MATVFTPDAANGGDTFVTNAITGYNGGVKIGGSGDPEFIRITGDTNVPKTVGTHTPRFQFYIPDSNTAVRVRITIEGEEHDDFPVVGPLSPSTSDEFNFESLPFELNEGETAVFTITTEVNGQTEPAENQKVFWTLTDIAYSPEIGGQTPPQLTVLEAFKSVEAGQPVSNTGNYAPGSAGPVTLSASIGTITPNTAQSLPGTWVWNRDPAQQSDEGTVTITATDGTFTIHRTFELDVTGELVGDYYVSGAPGASDSNPGTKAQPFRTHSKALSVAADNDTVLLERGYEYNDMPSGVPFNAGQLLLDLLDGVLIAPYGTGAKPIVDGGVNFPASSLFSATLGLVELRDCTNCTIRGLHIKNSKHAGATCRNANGAIQSDGNVLEECRIEGTRTWGFLSHGVDHNSGTVPPRNQDVTLRYCHISNACRAVNEPTAGGVSPDNSIGPAGGECATFAKTDVFEMYGCILEDYSKEGFDTNNSADGYKHHNIVRDRRPTWTGSGPPPEGFTAYGNGQGGSCVIDGSHEGVVRFRLDACDISGDAVGISVSSESGGDNDDILITNSIVHNCNTITFGIIGNAGNGNATPGDSTNVRMYNCLLSSSEAGQNIVKIFQPASEIAGFEMKGTILHRSVNSTQRMIFNTSGNDPSDFAGLGIDRNLFWEPDGLVAGYLGTNSIVADPQFESHTYSILVWPGQSAPIEADTTVPQLSTSFRPSATSPLIGALPSVLVATDMLGQPRTVPDTIGPIRRS